MAVHRGSDGPYVGHGRRAFESSMRREKINPFQVYKKEQQRMNGNNNNTSRPISEQMAEVSEKLRQKGEAAVANAANNTADALEAGAEALNQQAKVAREQVDRLTEQNNEREEQPILNNGKKSNGWKTARKYAGWVAGAGVVALGGYYLFGALRKVGAEVPAELEDAVAAAGEAVAAFVGGR